MDRCGAIAPGDQQFHGFGRERGESGECAEETGNAGQAPFWKKEQTPEGARWVEAKAVDDKAAERWK